MSQSGHEASFDVLAAEVVARLTPFDLVTQLALHASQEDNHVGLEPIHLDPGLAICVGSRIVAHEALHWDTLELQEGELVRRRSYQPMSVVAAYAGLLPRTQMESTAFFFQLEAPLQLPPREVSAPFTDVARRVLLHERPHGYNKYHELRTDDGVATLGQDATDMPVLATRETRISQIVHGTIRDKFGVQAAFRGPARLFLPAQQYLRIQADGLMQSSAEEGLVQITIPEHYDPLVQSDVDAVGDRQLYIGSEGQLVVPGPSTVDKFAANPRLSPATALDLIDNIPWTDITADFLDKTKKVIFNILAIDPQASYQEALTAARQTVADYLAHNAVQPIVGLEGSLLVANHIGGLKGNSLYASPSWAVDQKHFDRLSEQKM